MNLDKSSTYPTCDVPICLFFPECPYTLVFFCYDTSTSVQYYVLETYLRSLQYKVVRTSYTGFFSSGHRHRKPALPYKVKILRENTKCQYQSTRSPSTQWTEKSPALHHFYLLQRNDRQYWAPRAIATEHTLYTPYPMINVSHDTSHESAPTFHDTSRHEYMIKYPHAASQHSLCSLDTYPPSSPHSILLYTSSITITHRD